MSLFTNAELQNHGKSSLNACRFFSICVCAYCHLVLRHYFSCLKWYKMKWLAAWPSFSLCVCLRFQLENDFQLDSAFRLRIPHIFPSYIKFCYSENKSNEKKTQNDCTQIENEPKMCLSWHHRLACVQFSSEPKKKCLFRVEIWMKCSNFRTTSYDNHEAIWMKSQLWQATNSFKIKHWHNPLSLFMTLKLNWQSQYWSGRKNWINFVEIDEIDVWSVSGCDIIVVYTNCSYALWYFPMNFARALIEIPKRIVIFARISTFSPVWMHFARTNSDPQMVFTLLPSVRLLVAVKCTHSQQQWT